MVERTLDSAARWIAEADGLLIAAGAGMGVDSGLPDFCGTEGFWRAYPALGAAGIRFEAIASPAAFERDLSLAWGFYGHRLALYRRSVPHAGFSTLLRWATRKPAGAFVFTSNVDGQFQRAGFAERAVCEVHGSIHHLQCLRPCSDAIWPADAFAPQVDRATGRLLNDPPSCPHCGGHARPNVLMFGDGDWVGARTDAQVQRLQRWRTRTRHAVAIELGAGTAVATVRAFVERCGLPYIRINPTDAAVASPRGISLEMRALAALNAIDALLPQPT